MRRPLAFGAIVVGIVGAAAGLAGAQDPPTAVGWWSSDPTAQAEPDGGFQVAAALGSPTSVAALRFATPSGVTSATLTLTETGGFVTDASSVQVCVTTEPWQPANPGAMDDAPTADCANAVPLARDDTTWTAQVGPLLPALGGQPTLMIVPGAEPGGGSPLDPGFRVAFGDATLAVVAAPGTTTSTSTTLYTAPPPSGNGSSSGGGSFTPPAAVTPSTPSAPSTPATQPGSAPPASGDAFQPPDLAAGATPGSGGGGVDQPWERLLLLVPISAAVGIGTVQLRKQLAMRGVVEA